MTRKCFREWQRRYRKKGRSNCECGNLACVPRPEGWICERCDRLEKERDAAERKRARPDMREERRKWLTQGIATHEIRTNLPLV